MPRLISLQEPFENNAGIEVWLQETFNYGDPASGNKYYKLRDTLASVKARGRAGVISFGGQWSNHLLALALACERQGLPVIGVVRSDAVTAQVSSEFSSNSLSQHSLPVELTATLQQASDAGMQLWFVSRTDYRRRYDTDWLRSLQERFPNYEIVPEGGSNVVGVRACAEMLELFDAKLLERLTVLASAVGTGGTITGLASGLAGKAPKCQQVRGYSVVRDRETPERIRRWAQALDDEYRAGIFPLPELVDVSRPGIGKLTAEHKVMVDLMWKRYRVLLDPVYGVRLLCGLKQELAQGFFAPGSVVVAVSHGGLQGWRGLPDYNEA